jgi:murein L,D-transpeptidase YafK
MRSIVILIFLTLLESFTGANDFLSEQMKFERVRTAFAEKQKVITEKLQEFEIAIDQVNIIIVSFKAEQEIDIYAKRKDENNYKKITAYSICSSSGQLGPKRKLGDNQVPEGFYHIDRFNPVSNFYLSLGISYPNQSDRRKSKFNNLGGDIFIHGSCVTIGCMPMTNDKIKEIYLYALYARQNGQRNIPVYIFPFKMTDQNYKLHQEKYKANRELISFWSNLKGGFDKFENENMELNVGVDKNGDYVY